MERTSLTGLSNYPDVRFSFSTQSLCTRRTNAPASRSTALCTSRSRPSIRPARPRPPYSSGLADDRRVALSLAVFFFFFSSSLLLLVLCFFKRNYTRFRFRIPMENQQESSRDSCDSLALARKHVRALTDGGLSREALLRALLEQEEANNSLPPLPSEGAPHVQAKKASSLSRTLSLSQPKSCSHWSSSSQGTWLWLSSHLLDMVEIHPVLCQAQWADGFQVFHVQRVTNHQVQITFQHCRRPTPAPHLPPVQEAAMCLHKPLLQRSRQGQVPSLSFLALSSPEADPSLPAQEHTGAHRESIYPNHSPFPQQPHT